MSRVNFLNSRSSQESAEFRKQGETITEFFESEEKFRIRLVELFDQEEVESIISHERSHFEKAREFGYYARYLLKKLDVEENYLPSVYVEGCGKVPYEHLKQIFLAPEYPSESDIAKVRHLEELER